MLSATADTSAGLVGAVVMLVLIGYLHWQLAVRSFNLITALPDRVSRWFGAAPEAAGEDRQTSDVRGLLVHTSQSAARGAVPRTGQRTADAPTPAEPAGAVSPVAGAGVGAVTVAGADAIAGADAVTDAVTHELRSSDRVSLARRPGRRINPPSRASINTQERALHRLWISGWLDVF